MAAEDDPARIGAYGDDRPVDTRRMRAFQELHDPFLGEQLRRAIEQSAFVFGPDFPLATQGVWEDEVRRGRVTKAVREGDGLQRP